MQIKFNEKYNTKLSKNHGIVQKEFGVAPYGLLQHTPALNPWFDISYIYESKFKLKPTAKGKKGIIKQIFKSIVL